MRLISGPRNILAAIKFKLNKMYTFEKSVIGVTSIEVINCQSGGVPVSKFCKYDYI